MLETQLTPTPKRDLRQAEKQTSLSASLEEAKMWRPSGCGQNRAAALCYLNLLEIGLPSWIDQGTLPFQSPQIMGGEGPRLSLVLQRHKEQS